MKRFEIGDRQLRLIIKHFFEMRHMPESIDRVTVKPAAQMIVHSTRCHFAEREKIHLERMLAARRFGRARINAEEKIERHRSRKFWRATESAFVRIVAPRDLLIGRVESRRVERRCVATTRFRLRQRGNDLRPLLRDLFVILFPSSRDPFEHFAERRLPVSILRRKIGSANERFQFWRQPNTHRPTAAAGRGLDEGHVNAIDIRPLLAIDFDVYELAIHDRRHLLAFERLVRHDVAPVAGRIADGEKDRFVFAARLGKCFLAPRKPIDRIVRVLQKIRRFLVRQPVHAQIALE